MGKMNEDTNYGFCYQYGVFEGPKSYKFGNQICIKRLFMLGRSYGELCADLTFCFFLFL